MAIQHDYPINVLSNKLAVEYLRYSSHNQDEASIAAQRRAIHAWAQKNGITIIREYIDEARSATSDDRENFMQMIDDIRSGRVKVDYVLVHKLDRFARNRYDSAIYRKELQKKGVRLIAVTQPLDDSPESIILEATLEAMNEYFSRNLARETMKGLKENAYEGYHCGGIPPLGYSLVVDKIIPKNGRTKVLKRYVINEKEAEIVRLIFRMKADGHGYNEILHELKRRGMKTRVGKDFGKNSLYDLLKNEKYTGVMVYNKGTEKNHRTRKPEEEIVRVPGAIPQIVDEITFRKVQESMSNVRPIAARFRETGNIYILTGKIFCGECGAAMVGNREAKESWYSCNARKRTGACNNKNIRKDLIENLVLDELEKIFSRANTEKLVDMLVDRANNQKAEIEAEQKELQNQVKEIDKKMDRLFSAIETGAMDANVAGPRLKNLSNEKDLLTLRLRELAEMKSMPVLTREQIENYVKQNKQVVTDRSNLLECKRLIDTYIVRITVDNEGWEIKSKFYFADTDKLVVLTGFEPVSPP